MGIGYVEGYDEATAGLFQRVRLAGGCEGGIHPFGDGHNLILKHWFFCG